MKWLGILLMAMACAVFGADSKRLFLAWDADASWETNVTFYVYSTTNIAQPVAQWPYLTNIDILTATNAAKAGEGGRVEVLPAEDALRFYAIISSNYAGVSDFSSPVSVRRPARGTGMRIGAW